MHTNENALKPWRALAYSSISPRNDLSAKGVGLIAKIIERLETAAIMHHTEYHAGVDPMTDTKKDAKTSQPKILTTAFLNRIEGKVVAAT